MSTRAFRIGYRPPYNWESLLDFLSARATPGVEEVREGTYRRTIKLRGLHGILEVGHSGQKRALEFCISFPGRIPLSPLLPRLRAMFDLAADPLAIARHLAPDPLIGPLVKRYPGLRIPGAWDPYELAVRAILGQQVSVAGASTLAGRFAADFGERLSYADHGLGLLFPEPWVLAEAPLRGLPLPRAETIRILSRAVASRKLVISDNPSSIDGLAAIPGIGDWTLQYIAMRALHERDAFPASDLWLRRAIPGACTPKDLRNRAECWSPWRAYAAMYLWRSAGSTGSRGAKRAPGRLKTMPHSAKGVAK